MTSAFIARLAPAAFAALVLLAGCATPPAAPPDRPRLVVLLVVDGLPQRQLTDAAMDEDREIAQRVEAVAGVPLAKGRTLVTAESCTGGWTQRPARTCRAVRAGLPAAS